MGYIAFEELHTSTCVCVCVLCSSILTQVVGEIAEIVKTGAWVGDCFIYTNAVNRLNYYVGGEIVTISHLDRLGLTAKSAIPIRAHQC